METKTKELNNAEIKKLIALLGSDDGLERQKAREEMVKMGKDVIDYLLELLSHPKHIYRWEAIKTLEEIADPVSVSILIQAMEDDKADVRWIAAKGLIKIGKYSIIPLLKILEEKSDSVFILEGAHHVFFDLKEKNELPQDFPIDKILATIKSPEWASGTKTLAFDLLNKLEMK